MESLSQSFSKLQVAVKPSSSSLPFELMLQIISCMTGDTLDRADAYELQQGKSKNMTETDLRTYLRNTNARSNNKALRKIAFVSRALRSAAQETLHYAPNLLELDAGIWSYKDPWTPLNGLLRTILTRPDLGRKVRQLSLPFNDFTIAHKPPCQGFEVCQCGFKETYNLAMEHISSLEAQARRSDKSFRTKSTPRKRRWYYDALKRGPIYGIQQHLAVALLHLVPKLEHLELQVYSNDDEGIWLLGGIVRSYLKFPPVLVPGLSNLRSITVNFMLPWSIITLPNLSKIHYRVEGINFNSNLRDAQHIYLPSRTSKANVENLVLNLCIDAIEGFSVYALYKYIYTIQRGLAQLKHFEIRVTHLHTWMRNNFADLTMSYANLMPLMQVPSLETLVIDTSDVDWVAYSASMRSGADNYVRLSECVLPFDQIDVSDAWDFIEPTEMKKLRRIVAPEEAFFQHFHTEAPPTFRPFPLPPSIESIEIIDSSHSLNRWARYVLDHPGEFPNLRRIVLWCDQHYAPLMVDNRVASSEADGGMAPADNQVWEILEEIGIKVQIELRQEQGWRHVP